MGCCMGETPTNDTRDNPRLNPMDQQLLELTANGKRQTPKNAAAILDVKSTYVSSRSRSLIRRGYARDPGPRDRSGMFEITDVGRVAAHRIDKQRRGHEATFRELCQRVADNQPNDNRFRRLPYDVDNHPDDDLDPGQIVLNDIEERVARTVWATSQIQIAPQVSERDDFDIDTETAEQALYALYFFDLANRNNGMDVYSLSDVGKTYFGVEPTLPDR